MTDKQVQRETLGEILAFLVVLQSHDLRGWTVVFHNNAVSALAALRKGSSSSGTLQRLAADFAVLSRDAGFDAVFLHAPGVDLIREDIDAASGTSALALHGPSINEGAASLVHALALSLGWRISIDLFASRKNNITQHFFAQFSELDAEGRDALA